MSGFARDTKYYGDRLVYEPLESKWGRYHATHCGCGQDWLTARAIPAGFTDGVVSFEHPVHHQHDFAAYRRRP
ncbi:hypothetical protein ACWEP4_31480 [Streptomyces sp. NPDC004227]